MRILHLERGFVVVDKPAGLATVLHPEDRERLAPGTWPPTLERLLPALIRRAQGVRAAKGAPRQMRVVQRLDIGTSGVLVFARTRPAERALQQQLRRHSMQRRYLAVVQGALQRPRRIETLLVDNRGDGLRGSHPSRGQRAVTHVEPLESLGPYTLVACRLETGRTHQIRIQLAEAGLPLCGETLYNRPRFGTARPDSSGAPGIMLHAEQLGFLHPDTGRPLQFTVPPPPEFQAFLERLRAEAGAMSPPAAPRATPPPNPREPARPPRRQSRQGKRPR